ncbi:MAG: 50S ribosomal protein L21 [bacterium]|nr:50S ribosomal protein L21 [bacterium]
MFAIIESGAKQYRVSVGDRILVERLGAAPGGKVEFDRVLLLADEGKVAVGRPRIEGATVRAVVEGERKGKKLHPLKKKRRKGYRRRIGHRQIATAVRIEAIIAG